jgi:hypothetical protein
MRKVELVIEAIIFPKLRTSRARHHVRPSPVSGALGDAPARFLSVRYFFRCLRRKSMVRCQAVLALSE